MAAPDRMRRRLLRQVVQENMATMDGRPAGVRRLSQQARRRWLRRALLLVIPIVFAGGLLLVGLAAGLHPGWVLGKGPLAGAPESSVELVPLVKPFPAEGEGRSRAVAPPARFAAPAPFDRAALPLPVRTVVLDPGHGGHDFGTIGPGDLAEKNIALDIALRVRNLLADQGFAVLLTREHDEAVALDQRAAFANATAGDIFMSIHVNWIPNRATRGVETYYLGATDDPFLTQLATAENRNSGYSMSDFKRLVDGIYTDIRRDESRRLAEAVHGRLTMSLAQSNPGLHDRGVKQAPFIVLVATEMPAVLAEVSCLSNAEEARRLTDPGYRHVIARSLFAGIVGYARTQNAENEKGS